MKSYLISIIVPVYNQKRRRLERCINSLCRQSYSNIEIIVVDDGSEQQCYREIQEVCGSDQRITLLRQQNQGAGVARNLGVSEANGEYTVFVDSDDMLSDFAMEDAIHCLNRFEADLVVGQVHKEREADWKDSYVKRQPDSCTILNEQAEFNEYINHIIGYESKRFMKSDRYFCDGPVAKLCRTAILKEALFDDKNFWSEDTIWNLKCTKKCSSILISDNVWYYAFANEDSQTHVFRPNCEYEFCYRIKQEDEIISSLWPDCNDGLYTQIWLSTHYLFACFLIHEKNRQSFSEKYKVFLRCIGQPEYRKMLKGISFRYEEVAYKRVLKKLIRTFSLNGPKCFAYLGWSTLIKSRKGER